MKSLRTILLVYCALASLAGISLIAIQGVKSSAEGREIRALSARLEAAKDEHEGARDELLARREKQRLERDNYSPQEAIEASARTQDAIEAEARLKLELDAIEGRHSAAQSELRQQQLQLVPMVALTLLHLLLLPVFFRRKSQG